MFYSEWVMVLYDMNQCQKMRNKMGSLAAIL